MIGTESQAQTFDFIPETVTANDCMTISECSLCRIWPRPNLRTRITLFLTRLGIGVHSVKNIDELFVELNK